MIAVSTRLLRNSGDRRANLPRDGATGEDDGYVLALSYDRIRGHSELVVIPADDFAHPPLARVIIPRRVPLGFHAAWIPLS